MNYERWYFKKKWELREIFEKKRKKKIAENRKNIRTVEKIGKIISLQSQGKVKIVFINTSILRTHFYKSLFFLILAFSSVEVKLKQLYSNFSS